MSKFSRFGNTFPPESVGNHNYLLAVKPFKIMGNLYYVGNAHCSAHLIDTGEGLILLDTPFFCDFPYLIDSIWQLGFNPRDIKYIIVSHAHVDHYGCVKALVHMTGAKTFMGEIDVKEMNEHPENFAEMNRSRGYNDECFEADVALKDADVIELGNTKIRCALIPGHTIGTMAHFWEAEDEGKTYRVGIYGGAGFVTLTDEWIEKHGLPKSIKEDFAKSIDKVWDEPVDIMLGNHPFHSDTLAKRNRLLGGDKYAFVDPEEWQRFLTELKDSYTSFLKMTPVEVKEAYGTSAFMEFTGKYLELK